MDSYRRWFNVLIVNEHKSNHKRQCSSAKLDSFVSPCALLCVPFYYIGNDNNYINCALWTDLYARIVHKYSEYNNFDLHLKRKKEKKAIGMLFKNQIARYI